MNDATVEYDEWTFVVDESDVPETKSADPFTLSVVCAPGVFVWEGILSVASVTTLFVTTIVGE